jgi:hypothetical protein
MDRANARKAMTLDDALLDEQATLWARFLGTHLPARELDLAFDLTPPLRRAARADLSGERTRERYAACAHNRRVQLVEIVEHIRTLNRSRAAPIPRFAVAELALGSVAAIAREAATEILAGAGGIPEHPERRERLDGICSALQVMLVAYQTVLDTDYRKSAFWYLRSRPRVHRCAHRILELILLIQQLRALSYRRLDGAHWRIANTVFRAMLEYEQVDIPLECVGSLLVARRGRDRLSLRELYAALQVPWVLDFLSWPETLMPFVLEYCRSIRDAVVFLPEHEANQPHDPYRAPSDPSVPARALAWTRCYRSREPDSDPGPDTEGAALAIDYSVLATQAQADFQELCKARAERNPYLLPRRLARLDPSLHLAAAHLMVRVAGRDRCPEPHQSPRAEHRDLRIHAGFPEIFAHLQAVFDPDGRFAARRELSNLFAQRSATIGEDHTATEESLWRIVREDPERLRLQTQETRFTHRLTIGSFLAYGVGETGIRAPRLGKVARIHRPENGVVLVDLRHFADYARPVTVQREDAANAPDSPPGQPDSMRALLTCDDRIGWGLLLPEREGVWEHASFVLVGGARGTRLELSELRDLGEGYCLFGLRARQEDGRRPHYPRPSPGPSQGGPDSDSVTLRPRSVESS